MKMEYSFYEHTGVVVFTILIGGIVAIYRLLKLVNEWLYLRNLGEKRYSLPPGDMGWPFIGNMLSFLKAYKYGDPDSFISNLHIKFGHARIYKSFIFGNPSIILTTPKACRQVLMDEEKFGPGWPISVAKVLGEKGLHGISNEEHRRQRCLTAASVTGHEAISIYLEYIKDMVLTSLKELSDIEERPIEFLTEMRKIAFKIIIYIILGTESSPVLEAMEEKYTLLGHGLKAMPINLPGFAFHKALKARKELVKVFRGFVVERRAMLKTNQSKAKKFMVDLLMETKDKDGRKLSDEEIVDLIIIYLLAGHESFGHASTWAIIHLHDHPQYHQRAKEEQEEILKKRSSAETGLNLAEIKQMEYLSKVIDETLRLANLSFTFFRESKTEVNINGYTIPKGWKILPWIRGIHMDPETYPNPKEFNPSRWDNQTTKAASRPFMPFGAGSRLCPGMNLARIEITIFLHYFRLYYRLERLNPQYKVQYLPVPHPTDNCVAKIKKL